MNTLSILYHATLFAPPPHIPSPMERLPADILVLILQSISSLRSLRAAVLASSALNSAFRTAKIETLARVVSRSRPRDIHPDAVALSVLLHIQCGPTSQTVEALLDHNLRHPRKWQFMPRSLSSPDLLHFHWYVEYFTEKLFKSSMRYAHQKGWTGSAQLKFRRLSLLETIRIQRALYRLEFFSAYAAMVPIQYEHILTRSPYWRAHVSVWEMEELACVANLIFHRLAVVDTVIQSLIEEMNLQARLPDTPQSRERTKTLPLKVKGLLMYQPFRTLFRILTEPDKQSTRRIIQQTIRIHLTTLPTPFHHYFQHHPTPSVPIPHPLFSGRETEHPATLPLPRLLRRENTPAHPSYGYARAYRKTTLQLVKSGHMGRKQSSLYNEGKYHEERRWGYALWDEERMEDWGEGYRKDGGRGSLIGAGRDEGWMTVRIN